MNGRPLPTRKSFEPIQILNLISGRKDHYHANDINQEHLKSSIKDKGHMRKDPLGVEHSYETFSHLVRAFTDGKYYNF